MEQYQESIARELGLPISTFPSMFLRHVRHEIEHCHAGELHYLCSFFFQCSTQMHQLKSIPIPYNGFVRFEQLVMHVVTC